MNSNSLHLKIKRSIESEDLPGIKQCVADGADIHKRDDGFMCKTKGYTLLHWAVKIENVEIVDYFIGLGVDVKTVLPKAGDLLQFAKDVKNVLILDRLLALDFSDNARMAFFQSALFSAALQGNSKKIAYLLDKGADINMQNPHGESLLHYLVSFEKNFDALKLVVQKGIDLELKNNNGKTALDFALENRNEKVIHYLQQSGSKGESAEALHEIALFKAAANGDIATIISYIESGKNIDIKNTDNNTLLLVAFDHNQDAVVKRLLEAGANIHARDRCGFPVIVSAAATGNLEAIKLFLEHGADINDYGGSDPSGALLIQACYYGHYETVKFLLEHGANINEVDDYGRSALHIATYECHDKMADLLLQYNPDLTIEDTWGTKVADIGHP